MNEINWIVVLAVAAAIVACIWFLKKKKKEGKFGGGQKEPVKGLSLCTVSLNTPAGVRVMAQKSLSLDFLTAIDAALTKLFELARARGYTNKLNHSDYKIFVVPVEAYSPETHTPSFMVYAPNYKGSEYDPDGDGYIYAAEMVLSTDRCEFVILDVEDLQFVKETTHNGAEHILAWHNDRELYQRTETHTNESNGHPFIR